MWRITAFERRQNVCFEWKSLGQANRVAAITGALMSPALERKERNEGTFMHVGVFKLSERVSGSVIWAAGHLKVGSQAVGSKSTEGGVEMVPSSRGLAVLVLIAFAVPLTVVSSSAAPDARLCCSPVVACVSHSDNRAEPVCCSARVIKCGAESSRKGELRTGGWLGVHIQDLTPELREVLEVDEKTEGILVAGVNEDSPAEKAGIKKGDVIVLVDRRGVDDVSQLVKLVKKKEPGEKITLVIVRDGKRKKIIATVGKPPKKLREEIEFDFLPGLESFPGKGFRALRSGPDIECLKFELNRGRLGVRVISLNEELAEYFKTDEGALVIEVMEDSAAEEAGIKSGDVITEADGKPVEDSGDLTRLLRKREEGNTVELLLVRKGKEMKLDVVLEEGPFWAWVEGMKKKGTSMPHLYLKHKPEGLEEYAEFHLDMEALSDKMEKLEERLEELSEELGALRD